MIIIEARQRLILWGVEVLGDTLRAELAFIKSNIRNPDIQLIIDGRVCKVTLDPQFLNNDFPSKAQNVIFPVTYYGST